jgi:hypothetical protein
MTGEINGDNAISRRKRINLILPEETIAGPAVNEEQGDVRVRGTIDAVNNAHAVG